jgi:hypothetical protein
MNTQQTRLFKTVFYVLILQLIWGLINCKVNGEKITNVNIQNFVENKLLRGKNNYSFVSRKLNQKVDCLKRDSFNKCICAGSCMTHKGNNSYCEVEKCYSWTPDNTENKGTCTQLGHKSVAPIVLSIVPVTSMLGIGYGIIERWDLFGMQLGILLGPCCLMCCLSICIARQTADPDDNNDATEAGTIIFGKCVGCCWGVALLIFWILSMVWMSTPGEILDGDGCSLIF